MMIDTCLMSVVLLRDVELEPVVAVADRSALFFMVDLAYFCSNMLEDPRRRLVPAAGRRDRLHAPDDLGEGPPADDRAHERGEPADRDLHQVGGAQRRAGAGHGGVHDRAHERRPACAAAQSQAQQGAARARRAADGRDRGRAVCARERARRRSRTLAAGFYRVHAALRLHGRDRRPERARTGAARAARSSR